VIKSPTWTFYVTQSFSPVICLGFELWGTLGSRGSVGGVILAFRTFSELVLRSVQNLVEICLAVRLWKRDLGRYIGTSIQTVSFINTDICHFLFVCCLFGCLSENLRGKWSQKLQEQGIWKLAYRDFKFRRWSLGWVTFTPGAFKGCTNSNLRSQPLDTGKIW